MSLFTFQNASYNEIDDYVYFASPYKITVRSFLIQSIFPRIKYPLKFL